MRQYKLSVFPSKIQYIIVSLPQYASVQGETERYITADDFICKFLGLYTHDNANKSSIKLLAGAFLSDQKKNEEKKILNFFF